MELIAKLVNVTREYSGDLIFTFKTPYTERISAIIEEIGNDKTLRLIAKKWAKKRSLDSNAYCWLLITKIADVIGSSKEEVYEKYIQEYAPYYEDECGAVVITVRSHVDMSKIEGHWKKYRTSQDGLFTSYYMLKGSSAFTNGEMCKFVDHIVEDAKELGIETMTPDEIERIKREWERN